MLTRAFATALVLIAISCMPARDVADAGADADADAGFFDEAGFFDDAGFVDPGACEQLVQVDGASGATSAPAGVVLCSPGDVRRNQTVACTVAGREPRCAGQEGSCAVDADCAVGSCQVVDGNACACLPTCVTDADCPTGTACACIAGLQRGGGSLFVFSPTRQCVPSECASDDDCNGGVCAASLSCGIDGFHCRPADAACAADNDCAAGTRCGFEASTGWGCVEVHSCD